jgi:hypothetical protein
MQHCVASATHEPAVDVVASGDSGASGDGGGGVPPPPIGSIGGGGAPEQATTNVTHATRAFVIGQLYR